MGLACETIRRSNQPILNFYSKHVWIFWQSGCKADACFPHYLIGHTIKKKQINPPTSLNPKAKSIDSNTSEANKKLKFCVRFLWVKLDFKSGHKLGCWSCPAHAVERDQGAEFSSDASRKLWKARWDTGSAGRMRQPQDENISTRRCAWREENNQLINDQIGRF